MERSRLATSSATFSISRCRIACCQPCGGHRFTGVSATAAKRSTASGSETLRRSWPCTSSRDTIAPRAVRYLLMAAENARHRSAHYEAEALARRGLSALATLPPSPERDQQELSLRMLLGVSVMSLKGFAADEVKEIYAARARHCAGRRTPRRRPSSLSGSSACSITFARRCEHCHAIARTARRSCGPAGRFAVGERSGVCVRRHPRGPGQVRAGAGPVRQGCRRSARLRTIVRGERLPDRIPRSRVSATRPAPCGRWGIPNEPWSASAARARWPHPLSPAETQVIAGYFTAHLHQLRGEARAAQDHAESAIALADDYGLSVWVALSRIIRGWARVEQGEVEDGIDELRRGIAAYEATGARLWRAQALGFLAQALTVSGHHDQALQAVVEALECIRETREDGGAADLHRIRGDVLLARSIAHVPAALTDAEECLTRALTVARAQQARSWELRAATSLARLSCAKRRRRRRGVS